MSLWKAFFGIIGIYVGNVCLCMNPPNNQLLSQCDVVKKMPFFELALSAFHDRVSQSVFVTVLSAEKNKNKTETEKNSLCTFPVSRQRRERLKCS